MNNYGPDNYEDSDTREKRLSDEQDARDTTLHEKTMRMIEQSNKCTLQVDYIRSIDDTGGKYSMSKLNKYWTLKYNDEREENGTHI